MAKVIHTIKLEAPAGSLKPGQQTAALSSKGIKAIEVCKDFNDKTKNAKGKVMRLRIEQLEDKSYRTIIKGTPTPLLLKEIAGLDKGSSVPNRDKVAQLSMDQVRKIAEIKFKDTNAFTLEAAMEQVKGTARNMGITVTN